MRWTIKPKPSEEKVKQLAQALNVKDFVATLLVQRGIETFDEAKRFFRPTLNDLHDPYLMKDMEKAVNRIEKAIENYKKLGLEIAVTELDVTATGTNSGAFNPGGAEGGARRGRGQDPNAPAATNPNRGPGAMAPSGQNSSFAFAVSLF
jgi:hypothetical protein